MTNAKSDEERDHLEEVCDDIIIRYTITVTVHITVTSFPFDDSNTFLFHFHDAYNTPSLQISIFEKKNSCILSINSTQNINVPFKFKLSIRIVISKIFLPLKFSLINRKEKKIGSSIIETLIFIHFPTQFSYNNDGVFIYNY